MFSPPNSPIYTIYNNYNLYNIYNKWYNWYMEQSLEDVRFFIANYLKNRRKELGLTQEEVAGRMGVLQPHIARAETVGPRSVDMFIQWTLALDLKIILEPLHNTQLVEKALDDPEAIEELIDAPPEEIVEIATLEEVLSAGKNPNKAIVITDKTTVKELQNAKPGEAVEFCKHGSVKGFCKKGCK